MNNRAGRTTHQIDPSQAVHSILRRAADKDKTAIRDCIEKYGNFVWTIAKKFTASAEEAEEATLQTFLDIWKHAERLGTIQCQEKMLIALIARRRLKKPCR